MAYSIVKLSQLNVNQHNDRHGELPSEDEAIKWLLKNRSSHMKNLAKDIASEGKVYEPPLVFKGEDGYIVLDGNRRVTCLKLLNNPTLSPNESWLKFFQKQAADFKGGTVPSSAECRVETDLDYIDELLYRRHTGSQSGIGQSHWDDVAKANFVERSGKKTKINLAEEIENLLKKSELVSAGFSLPRSNLNRLLSGQSQRNRVGISLKKNKITFTHDPETVMVGLKKIAEDLKLGKIILKDIWDIQGKNKYLNLLASDDLLPKVEHALDELLEFKYPYPKAKKVKEGGKKKDDPKPDPKPEPKPEPAFDPATRSTLIPQGFEYNLPKNPKLNRVLAIWNELEWKLHFENHTNAISVLFRVLLELSIEHYSSTKGVEIHPNDKMKVKFAKITKHQLSEGNLDKKDMEVLKKFANTEPLLSAHTMNQYVHSKNFSPSPEHLRPMWDNLQKVILNCLCCK